jgi:acetyltransferase-like isoleucine patch superfamily enzyme
MRAFIFWLNTFYWRARTLNRVSGGPFYIGHVSRLSVRGGRVVLGRNVHIDKGARIVVRGAELRIDDSVFVGKNSTIVCYSNLSIGCDALVGENVSLHTEDHGPAGDREAFSSAPISIGRDAWICAGVVVTKGVDVGEASTVAANAVVTRSVPARVIVGGVPATLLKRIE